ncbi:hypothetical protein KOR42_22350 [Thalassoglobus neptunius]|uniref:Uncharacterized protein n=1 Tax=Thalassoglobus neptunius TaxID=1938619 RepID=A0A5C5X7T2_9PLAN|nr:hypothetical protein KOR42_22350 [Thalassoglobus neptunius]
MSGNGFDDRINESKVRLRVWSRVYERLLLTQTLRC